MSKKFLGFFLTICMLLGVFTLSLCVSAENTAVLPAAEVENLGAISVGGIDSDADYEVNNYYVYDLVGTQKLTTSTELMNLLIAMQFDAKETEEQALAGAYGEYITDFYITIDGIEDGSFAGDGCYLAGYYESYNAWVKIPLDGFTVENGKIYPVITSAGHYFTYASICGDVESFKCGIYFTPEVIEANPDMTVTLTLGLSETREDAQNAVFTEVDSYTYTTRLPDATVENLGAISVGGIDSDADYEVNNYYVYDLVGTQKLTTSTEYSKLQIAMQFDAKETEEEALLNVYGGYYTDFYIEINGIEDGSFAGDGCYLMGYYDTYGAWVKIPLDGFTVENGMVYPVITSAGHYFTYASICGDVESFKCGIYFTPEIIENNPDIELTLYLGLGETKDKTLNSEFVEVDSYTFRAPDFHSHEYVKGNLVTPATRTTEAEFEFVCSCGDSYVEEVDPTPMEITYYHTVIFRSSYVLNFRVDAAIVPELTVEGNDHWFDIVEYKWENGVVTPITAQIEGVKNDNRYDFEAPGIPGAEMNDKIVATYYQIVDGIKYVAQPDEYNLVSYYNKIKNNPDFATLVPFFYEVFNYGAAAQVNFGYNTTETEDSYTGLVNRHIPEEYRKFDRAAYGEITINKTRQPHGDKDGMAYTYGTDTGEFVQQITLRIKFNTVSALDYAGLKFVGSYTKLNGTTATVEISGDEFYTDSLGRLVVSVDTIATPDLRAELTGAIYDANGNRVSETVTTSFEAYATAVLNNETRREELKTLMVAAINYANAARAYFED